MAEPVISVAAVTYRNLEATRRFVESVYENTKEPFELVMVDNGSTPDLAAYLKELAAKDSNFILIQNPSNMGIGIAMNQAMRRCRTDHIFRCDTDVEIQTMYWTSIMRELADDHPEIGAVGNANNTGRFIQRSGYVETDIILSHCMYIPRRTINAINAKMRQELPRISLQICSEILKQVPRYDGWLKHLGGMLNYMHLHGGFWDVNFPYGADDFHYSKLVRYAGLRLAKEHANPAQCRVRVLHKDESMRTDWQGERHRRVSTGFQYYRTFWEQMERFDTNLVTDMWDCFPMNIAYREEADRVFHSSLAAPI